MGLDIYLRWKGMTKEEEEAQCTGFKSDGNVGYLRSSYNPSGFNNWCERALGKEGFYYIFEPPSDGDAFTPNWDKAKERTLELIKMTEELPPDNLYVSEVHLPVFPIGKELPTISTVLRHYREEEARNKSYTTNYTNWCGTYFIKDPVLVKAVIWVKADTPFEKDPKPVLIVQVESDPNKWQKETLQTTLQFIELGKKKKGYLHWSS